MKYAKVKIVDGTLGGLNHYLEGAVKIGWQPLGPATYTNNRIIGDSLTPKPFYVITVGLLEESCE